MKKMLFSSMLFFSLIMHAQIDSTKAVLDTSNLKFIEPPDSTGFGVPDGVLVSKEIGPAGGTIASDDGRVELIFPEDALTANTNISVQPITNLAPNGAGKAYKCEPSGIRFKKPVQIIFHYTDKEAKTCPPEYMGLVIQDDTGKWTFFDYDDWDSATKILKGTIEHFSRLASSLSFYILPAKDRIMVNEEVSILVSITHKKSRNKKIRPLSPGELSGLYSKWFVNSDEGGNASIGTILNSKVDLCTYKAPLTVPEPNPVTITVNFSIGPTLSCDIEVYDGYKVTITGTWKDFSFGEIHADFSESSSFIIKREVNGKWRANRNEIKNGLLLLDGQLKCPPKCGCQYVNKNTCTGLLNIDGIDSVKISGNNGSQTMLVYFEKTRGMLPILSGNGTVCPKLAINVLPGPGYPAAVLLKLDGSNQPKQEPIPIRELAFEFTLNIMVTRLKPDD